MMLSDILLLKESLEIYSPSGEEGEVANFFVEQMKLRGLTAHIDDAGNAIGEIGEGAKTILFMGHIDTVPGVIPVHLHDDALWGRGACDAKGGIAAAIAAVGKLTEEELRDRRIVIAGCVEEEISTSKGARNLLTTMEEPDFIINGEPSGSDAITIGYKGCLRFEYKHKQTVTHHASNEPAANEHAFNLIRGMHDYLDAQEYKKDSAFYTPYVELRHWQHDRTGLEESIHIKGNVRIPPNFGREEFLTHTESLGAPGRLKFTETIDGIELSRGSYLARTFMAIMRQEGITPRCKVKTGSSDMNVVVDQWKTCEMLAYSPGDSSLDHTPNEHIQVADYEQSIVVLQKVFSYL